MKIIFLDIDGPMIPARASINSSGKFNWRSFDPVAVNLLNTVINDFAPKLVISSTWRHMGEDFCRLALTLNGISGCNLHKDWATKVLWGDRRGDEIKDWLDEHDGVTHWAAIDDAHLNLPEEHFVKVSFEDGLLYKDYYKIRNILRDE